MLRDAADDIGQSYIAAPRRTASSASALQLRTIVAAGRNLRGTLGLLEVGESTPEGEVMGMVISLQ